MEMSEECHNERGQVQNFGDCFQMIKSEESVESSCREKRQVLVDIMCVRIMSCVR